MNTLRLVLGFCLFVLMFVSVLGTQSKQAYRPASDVGVVSNQTQALRVASFTDSGSVGAKHTYEISLVNVSDKAIVEYTFFKKDGSALTTSGATTGWSLGPDESDVIKVELDAGDNLTLAALLFADGTGQGDLQEITRMRDYRDGVEEQYQRVVPILNRTKNTPPATEANYVSATLRQQLSLLPVPPVGGSISRGKAAGLHDAKQFVEVQVTRPQGAQDEKTVSLEALLHRVDQALGHVQKALLRFDHAPKTRQP